MENALYEWDEGERRVRDADPRDAMRLETAVDHVLEELRHRLGSTFSVDELADFYFEGSDWARDLAESRGAGYDSAAVADAAFRRYAREARNYAGGRARPLNERG